MTAKIYYRKTALRLDDKQWLAELDKLTVLRHHFDDRAFDGGAHAVEDFHYLDQTDGRVFGDLLADFDEGRCARFRRDIKCTEKRRGDRQHAFRNYGRFGSAGIHASPR